MTPELAFLLSRSPADVAPALIGWTLISTGDDQERTGGIICETEAYLPQNDPAAHNRRGPTRANSSLFKCAGTLYVHQMRQHLLLDIVTLSEHLPGSVLVRSIIPTIGVDLMLARRGVSDIKTVTTGPGNLAKALGIKRSFDGKRLGTPECMLNLAPPTEFQNPQIKRSNRIGVTLDLDEPMRFFAEWGQFPLDFRER